LLRKLEQDPYLWFLPLRAITGADPVPPEQRGNVDRMTEAWLRWGKEQGHQW
jgi:hypothetical protein